MPVAQGLALHLQRLAAQRLGGGSGALPLAPSSMPRLLMEMSVFWVPAAERLAQQLQRLAAQRLPKLKSRHSGSQIKVQELCRRALHARADVLDAADHLLCGGAVCTRVY